MDDFQIELGRSVRRQVGNKRSPLHDRARAAVPYDEPQSDAIPVFVALEVMRAIEALAVREQDREIGGVLLGSIYRDKQGDYVEVTDHIEAASAASTGVSLTFTHEAWEEITAEQARRASTEEIVGWYHSHPGLGVFMSKEDEFIHSSFFAEAGQVAIVVDPIHQDWGCFASREGDTFRCGGFYVFADRQQDKSLTDYVESLIASRQLTLDNVVARAGAARIHPITRIWIAVAVLLMMQLAIGYLALTSRFQPANKAGDLATAMDLLSVSDLSGAESYLRQALLSDPADAAARREFTRLSEILADPALANAQDARLDRVNFSIYVADLSVGREADYPEQPELGGLDLHSPHEQYGSYSPKLAAQDPVSRAVKLYEAAAATHEARFERARLVRGVARRLSPRTKQAWFDRACDYLQQEPLRLIALGRRAGDREYADAYAKLSKADRKTVDGITGRLFAAKK